MAYTWPHSDISADVYVDINYAEGASDGSITDPYTVPQTGFNATSAGETLAIAEGTYLVSEQWYNKAMIIRLGGIVTFEADGVLDLVHTNEVLTVYGNLRLKGAPTSSEYLWKQDTNSGTWFEHVIIAGTNASGILFSNVSATIKKLTIEADSVNENANISLIGASEVTLNIEVATITGLADNHILITNTHASTVVNIGQCILSSGGVGDSSDQFVVNRSGFNGAININNCIGIPGKDLDNNDREYSGTGGTGTSTNSVLLGNPVNTANSDPQGYTDVNPIDLSGHKSIMQDRKQSYITIGIDDISSTTAVDGVFNLCVARNIAFYLSTSFTKDIYPLSVANLTKLQNIEAYSLGELCSHSYMPEATGLSGRNEINLGEVNAMTITRANDLTIDVATDSLTMTGSPTIDLTLSDYVDVQALVAAINAIDAGIAIVYDATGTSLEGCEHPTTLADITAEDCTAGYNAEKDWDRVIEYHIVGLKTDFIAHGLAPPTSHVYNWGFSIDENELRLSNLGWLKGARSSIANGGTAFTDAFEPFKAWSIRAVDLVPSVDWGTTNNNYGINDAEYRLRSLFEWAKHWGVAINIYGHAVSEYSLADWTKLLDVVESELNDSDSSMVTLRPSDMYDAIAEAGTTGTAGSGAELYNVSTLLNSLPKSLISDEGVRWWTGPNPTGADGEPFSDFDTSIGDVQSKDGPFHPTQILLQL